MHFSSGSHWSRRRFNMQLYCFHHSAIVKHSSSDCEIFLSKKSVSFEITIASHSSRDRVIIQSYFLSQPWQVLIIHDVGFHMHMSTIFWIFASFLKYSSRYSNSMFLSKVLVCLSVCSVMGVESWLYFIFLSFVRHHVVIYLPWQSQKSLLFQIIEVFPTVIKRLRPIIFPLSGIDLAFAFRHTSRHFISFIIFWVKRRSLLIRHLSSANYLEYNIPDFSSWILSPRLVNGHLKLKMHRSWYIHMCIC